MLLQFIQRVAPAILSICFYNSTPIQRPELVQSGADAVPLRRSYGYMGKPLTRATRKIGRNEPCTCGSMAKYKACCGK